MRTTPIFALALTLIAAGCSGTNKVKVSPQADPSPTPVARSMPSLSHRIISKNLREGQEVAGNTDVEGALVR